MATPSIACIGIIGKNNNPLHITSFNSSPNPTTHPFANPAPILSPLQFSLLLASSLDLFEAKLKANAASGTGLSGDFGLLHAVDERLSVYGFETNTGARFVVVVDMAGRRIPGEDEETGARRTRLAATGVRDGEMKIVFRAIQAAYIRLLQNPFYDPDEHSPVVGRGGKSIKSKKFSDDMKRIGEKWRPGMTIL